MRYIDPELKYCPQCDDEYREDMITCVACNIDLIDGSKRLAMENEVKEKFESRSMDISPDDELANIRKGPLAEMKYLKNLLASENIPALVFGEDDSCGKGCCGSDFYLQIKVADGDESMEVLAKEFKRTTALDSHDLSNVHAVFDTGVAKSTCPACGTQFSTSECTCPDCGLCF